jgi:hypothetical protein
MNQSAIALAADSAATMSGTKIFAANKIFALSKYEPVAVMIYGNASCMQVPWETIVKEFRAELGETSYPTVEAYGAAFLEFMGSNRLLFPEIQQEMFAYMSACHAFVDMRERIVDKIEKETSDEGGINEARATQVIHELIEARHQMLVTRKNRPGLPRGFRQKLREEYGKHIDQAITSIFEKLVLTKKVRSQLVDIVINLWCKDERGGLSGVVFAGFGTDEIFPSAISYEIDGVLLNRPILWTANSGSIDYENEALILGFAQADMIHLFIEGVTPQYEGFVEAYFEKIVAGLDQVVADALPDGQLTPELQQALEAGRNDLIANLSSDLSDHRHNIYIQPVLRIVASLPKDELGELAESLVNLTSLKRRVSLDEETVGGPIDVVVISRGDGLIWTRRKHYFAPEFNHQFFTNYYRSR